MTVQSWTFLLVASSFALYIGIAIWSRASTTKEFYVAGTDVSPLANGHIGTYGEKLGRNRFTKEVNRRQVHLSPSL